MENTIPLVVEQTYESLFFLVKVVITLLSSLGIMVVFYFIFQLISYSQKKKQNQKIDKILLELEVIKNKLKIK